jgi:hypothetical protein
MNRQFSDEVQMANKYMKKCSPSLAMKEMQIKMTLRSHLTPMQMAINKKTTKSGKDGVWRNSGIHACQAGTLPLKPHLQPFCF